MLIEYNTEYIYTIYILLNNIYVYKTLCYKSYIYNVYEIKYRI